jgi:hypothetical protein
LGGGFQKILLTPPHGLSRIDFSLLFGVGSASPTVAINALDLHPRRVCMHQPGCPVVQGFLLAGALALAVLPSSAQRVSADSLKNGHFPQALRGRLDAHPDKSLHPPSASGAQSGAFGHHGHPPQPIVSPFLYPSSRSGSFNYGFVVGQNPFSHDDAPGATSVRSFIVPVVIKVHQVATEFSVDANNNLVLTGIQDQDMTYDPTVPAPACLGKKNNVPFTLAVQSPVFQNHHWAWGGTDLGNAQYVEAFQRANFWNVAGGRYGVHLNAQTLPPLVIDFPKGTAIGLPQSSSLLGYSACSPSVMVDFTLFDEYLDYVALPQMASAYGVDSSTFPIFIGGNVLWGAVSGQLPYFEPQAAGYHSYSSVDPAQTYGVTEFGDENVFTWPDAMPLSHEVGEWMNDPTGANAVQAYNVAAVSSPKGPASCQGNYEVGDILTGVYMPPVVGNNGFSYTLQEMAFFSYFYGGPPLGANGWYSNNGTLTSDAGPACSPF